MHSLLSGDFEDLLCESLEASSVKEGRGQVSGVEGHTTPSPLLTDIHTCVRMSVYCIHQTCEYFHTFLLCVYSIC